jgi:hypothetical protein
MSSAVARVRFDRDKVEYWAIYHGTVGIMGGSLHDNLDNAWGDASDKGPSHPDCSCGQEEDVTVAVDYGGGFHWSGTACRHCMAFIGPKDPFQARSDLDEYENGSRWLMFQPSPKERGEPLPVHLVNFSGVTDGLPGWWKK